ncbi:MAG: universal stress protein [Woeseiaceae bacterium]|nr:universal stress protein [Woeseiaceae bacterium]
MACVELAGSGDEPGSMDDNVIETGKELARVLKGRLVVFHAFDPMTAIGHAATWAVKPELLPGDALRRKLRDAQSDVLDRFAGRHGLPADQRLLKSGSVRSTLPGTVTELHATVTILGAVGGRDDRNGRGRIGSTAESVMDHIAGDLLVLQPGS